MAPFKPDESVIISNVHVCIKTKNVHSLNGSVFNIMPVGLCHVKVDNQIDTVQHVDMTREQGSCMTLTSVPLCTFKLSPSAAAP